MTPTPILRPIVEQGGTLYVFPSVSRDLTKTLVSSDYEFKFSHFACINIPDIKSGKYSTDKGFYIDSLKLDNNNEYYGGYDESTWSSDGMAKTITENIQNYVMNFETAILNGEGDNDDYDPDILTTVSEKVFWNWMQKVGAIKFNASGTQEEYGSYADRTVQYLGDIDMLNTVEINGDVFEELYIHVPSTAGASTHVYFRTGDMTDDKNYLDKYYSIANGDLDPEDMIGRDADNEQHPYGLSMKAIYDKDKGANIYSGDVGHTIDFRDSSYDNGYGINNMNAKSLEDFEFNAVLIYYDLTAKTTTPGVKRVATNLYGILFLDNVTDQPDGSGVQGFFQRYPKKKETVYGNGNSYALKLDLKIDTIGDTDCTYTTIAVPVAVPSNSQTPQEVSAADWGRERLVSMIQYVKSLTQLQKCIDFFYEQKQDIIKLSERISTLENMILGIDSVSSMREDIKRLYDLCDGNAIVDTSTLLGLIDKNTKRLDTIMNGGKDLKLQFDTDVLQPGAGIGLVKTPNKVIINSEQRYSVNEIQDIDGNDISNVAISTTSPQICIIPLKSGENFAVININDQGDCDSNFNIRIDETDYQWEVGQSMKIYFVCEEGSLRFNAGTTSGIVIKPKSNVTLNVSGDDFEGHNLIEVVCVALPDTNDTGSVMDTKFVYLIS